MRLINIVVMRVCVIFLYSLILLACDEKHAGGTTTEPFVDNYKVAAVGGEIDSSGLEDIQAYIYDIEEPYEALDSAKVGLDGQFQFDSEKDLPARFRVLVSSERELGALTDTLEADSLIEEGVIDDRLALELSLEPYQIDTVRIVDTLSRYQLRLAYSQLPAPLNQEGVFFVKRLITQDKAEFHLEDQVVSTLQFKADSVEIEGNQIQPQQDLEAVQVEYYQEFILTEINGSIIPPVVGSYDASWIGTGVSIEEGRSGVGSQALEFESAYLKFQSESSSHSDSHYAVDFWFQNNCTGQCGVMGTDSSRFVLMDNGYVNVAIEADAGTDVMVSTTSFNIGDWIHVMIQYEAGLKAQLFINGTLEANTVFAPKADLPAVQVFHLGAALAVDGVISDKFLTGRFAEFRHWQRVLTEAEVLKLSQGVFP